MSLRAPRWPAGTVPAVLAALVVLVVVTVGLVALPQTSRGRVPTADGRAVAEAADASLRPIQQRLLACPAVPDGVSADGSPVPLTSTLVALAAPSASAASASNSTEPGLVSVSDGSASPLLRLDAPQQVGAASVSATRTAVVDARGGLAAGTAVSRTLAPTDAPETKDASSTAAQDRQVVDCGPALSESAVAGLATTSGQRPLLLLANPSATAAVAQVQLFTPSGPVVLPAGGVVAVAPHATRQLALDALAPDVADLGVHVVARQGRVLAVVRVSRNSGLTTLPPVWAAAAVPGREQLLPVPRLPSGVGAELTLVAPGSSEAVVSLRWNDATGATSSLPPVTVPAHSTASVALPATAGAGFLQVSADVAVAGAVRVGAAAPGPNAAVIAPVSRTRAAAGAAVCLPEQSCHLLVSAPGAAARVTVSRVTSAGVAGTQRVEVPSRGTVEVPLEAASSGTTGAEVSVVSGGEVIVTAVTTASDGPLTRVAPLPVAAPAVPVPVVSADPRTSQ